MDTELTEDERALLDVARASRTLGPSARTQAIWDRFRCSPGTFTYKLNRLIETERALAADPQLVNWLRRRRGPSAVERLGEAG